MFSYPITLTPDDGTLLVRAPDLPELITYGETEAEALAQARNALVAVLEIYRRDKRDFPAPSPADGRPTVSPPIDVQLKAALYQHMRRNKIRQETLADQLGIDSRQIRRLLDFTTDNRVGELARALEAVGLTEAELRPAA
jgi:antitoxin HicB